MDNTWILVANASTATLYNFIPPESPKSKLKLTIVAEYRHPDSRKKDNALVSDREGQYQKGSSTGIGGGVSGHGNFVEASDPHQHEAAVFARELYHHVEDGRKKNQFHSLILVASPHFMGLLRQCIDDHPIKHMLPIQEIHKDYTSEKPEDLISLLNLKEKS